MKLILVAWGAFLAASLVFAITTILGVAGFWDARPMVQAFGLSCIVAMALTLFLAIRGDE